MPRMKKWSPSTKWEVDRDQLPDRINAILPDGRVVSCQVTGKRLDFPRIILPDGGSVEVSAWTIMQCHENNRMVIV
jgi:hypothetical protein